MNWLNKITNIGIHKELESTDISRIQLSNLLIFSIILVEFFFTFYMLIIGNTYFYPWFLTAGLLNVSIYIFVHRQHYTLAVVSFNILGGSFVCFLDYHLPDVGSNLFLIIVSFFPFLVLKNLRLGYFLFSFWILIFLANISFNIHSDHTFFNPGQIQTFHLLALIIFSSLVFVITVYYKRTNDKYALILKKKNGKIDEQIKMLEEIDKDTKESIDYAKYLQQAIIPSFDKINNYLPHNFIFNKPKETLSGDFCWFEHLNGCSYIAVADCTGHGVPGAMVSLVCSNALFRSLIEFDIYEPAKILDKTRELVIETFSKNRKDVREGMDIALYKLEGTKLFYSGAYNPLWVIRDNEIIELKADRQTIGKHENVDQFSSHELELQKDDTIYIFSDGYLNQFGGEKGKKYKSRKFKKFLISIQEYNMQEQLRLLDKEFENWKGELMQVDDVCVAGVRIK